MSVKAKKHLGQHFLTDESIAEQIAEFPNVPFMLISNYEDAQAQAVELGAVPGFGKSSINSSETVERLQIVLGRAS